MLLRGIESLAVRYIFLFVLISCLPAAPQAKTAAVQDTTWASWPGTTYYMAQLSGPNAPYDGITVHITAVDRYSLWINGIRIDTPATNDGVPGTVDTYSLAGTFPDIFIAIATVNLGLGNGNGLLVDIEAGPDHLGTTIDPRWCRYENGVMRNFPTAWYCFTGDIVQMTGKEDWYRFDPFLFSNIRAFGFKPVQCGKINVPLDYTPAERIQVIAGFEGNVDTASNPGGGITLRKIDGENLAEKKPADFSGITDGDVNSGYRYESSPLNSTKAVDLMNLYRLTRVVVYTGGNSQEWPYRSPRGFAADISMDFSRWEEVGVIQEIGITNPDRGSYGYAEVSFPPQITRFVRYHIIAERDSFPNVGEMMIYGTGYAYSGEYASPWINCADKTIQQFSWNGDTPEGTSIAIKIQTLSGSGMPSDWSNPHTEKSFAFTASEPAAKFRYKVLLSTSDPGKTPVFTSFTYQYSKGAVSAETESPVPFRIYGNSPNPFNPSTSIAFSLPEPGLTTLVVYDVTGRAVRTLLSGSLSRGNHTVVWNGRDDRGKAVSSGVYITRLVSGGQSVTHRMLMMK